MVQQRDIASLPKQLLLNYYMTKQTTDDCYLEYDEDGYLYCSFNHKAGDECLMDTKEEL